jgi:peptidoglycan/LPS O-acetylase OafA/YrhL
MSTTGSLVLVVNGLGFLSVALWRFFLFFCVGAWMRRHFDAFIRWTSKPAVILVIAVAFFAIASTSHIDNMWFEMFRFYVGGITGMWLVFTCFRLSESWLQKLRLSKPLQYVGTRTLDIYLLHYFFLPRFLMPYADQLKAFDSHFLEFWAILAVSLIVLLFSLLTSYIIRLSPFLGHYLFGVKRENTIG